MQNRPAVDHAETRVDEAKESLTHSIGRRDDLQGKVDDLTGKVRERDQAVKAAQSRRDSLTTDHNAIQKAMAPSDRAAERARTRASEQRQQRIKDRSPDHGIDIGIEM